MEKRAGVNKQELPVDLIFEILTKLPVRSLCRFRCVSKLWRSVIADPRFVEAQHACSAARPEFLVILGGPDRITEEPIRHVYTCKLDTNMELHSPDHRGSQERGIISHQAGGLYCLNFPNFVRVWNPATREALDIETPSQSSGSINHFGFDPVEKKHKVLNLLTEYNNTTKAIRSRVFILGENCWRTTASPYPLHSVVPGTEWDFICIDGIIFSVAYTADFSEQKLTAFHVRSETFEVISVPKSRKNKWWMIEFTGRLALVKFYFSRHGKGIVLLVLEDLRKQVWRRKECVIPDFNPTRLTLWGGTPTGELFLTGGGSSRHSFFLLLYNVESRTARRIEVQSLPELTRQQIRYAVPRNVYFHVESLQSPKGASSLTSATHV